MKTNNIHSLYISLIISLFLFTSCQWSSQYTYQQRSEKKKRELQAKHGGSSSSSNNNNSSVSSNTNKENKPKSKKGIEHKIPPGKKLTPQEYIDYYKDYAIESMHHKKVPASITLAQGLLESGAGNSSLARATNNHFGIKCGGNWSGNTYKYDDDRPNECFRVYNSVLDSYEDHGNFLRTRSWYAPLFKLKITDYKGWAKGLKKAGYATDPKYPSKLINIIEKYRLYEYDKR
ncbi:glucosaminidase domain-containing protein [Flammeovirga sp. MY04]|uniref:glycoside hydrolase family 73 protein n=1 Tax=Flammeovirga sp. MY04 TaxID=1191459 RepID=UPI0008061E9C|nr:glucosaminidase domain-containing protein [Flammeovirga sp. MY04]ANQ51058.1 glucosaminidase domain-containing protein [Flammeovirga sp. MY04]